MDRRLGVVCIPQPHVSELKPYADRRFLAGVIFVDGVRQEREGDGQAAEKGYLITPRPIRNI
jgi:hypothetical protein